MLPEYEAILYKRTFNFNFGDENYKNNPEPMHSLWSMRVNKTVGNWTAPSNSVKINNVYLS